MFSRAKPKQSYTDPPNPQNIHRKRLKIISILENRLGTNKASINKASDIKVRINRVKMNKDGIKNEK